MFSFRKVLLV